jgi:bacterioferritin (cytochrome b1)
MGMLLSRKEMTFDFGGAKLDPGRDRDILSWMANQFLYGEVTGIQIGHWLYQAPDLESARFLARQAIEELQHVDNFLRIMAMLGLEPAPANPVVRFLATGMMGGSWAEHVAMEMASGEGLVLMAFYAVIDTLDHPSAVAILRRAVRQEERHVDFGERQTMKLIGGQHGARSRLQHRLHQRVERRDRHHRHARRRRLEQSDEPQPQRAHQLQIEDDHVRPTLRRGGQRLQPPVDFGEDHQATGVQRCPRGAARALRTKAEHRTRRPTRVRRRQPRHANRLHGSAPFLPTSMTSAPEEALKNTAPTRIRRRTRTRRRAMPRPALTAQKGPDDWLASAAAALDALEHHPRERGRSPRRRGERA